MNILIRRYLSTDRDITISIFLQAIYETASKDYNPSQINAWAKVDDIVLWNEHQLKQHTWVAEYQQKVIGFCSLTATGYLDMMFILPMHQHKGIATALLNIAEKLARKLKLFSIYTEASLTAYSFFLHKGFEVLTKQQVKRRGEILENYVMEKILN